MRYTFAQLLELQNDLNRKIDYDKVDKTIDCLLEDLEKEVRETPIRKSYSFDWACSKDKRHFLYTFSQSELDLILKKLELLGFRDVKIEQNTSYFPPLKINISWE